MSAIAGLYCNQLSADPLPSCPVSRRCPALELALLVCLAFTAPVQAQTVDDYAKRELFEFEQCANVCQIQLDQRMFICMPYRQDKSRAVPENCPDDAYEKYDMCMKYCPADPRR